MRVTSEQVLKALDEVSGSLISKSSEDDLDQPEGADMGNPAKDKMSDASKAKKALSPEEQEELASKAKSAKKAFPPKHEEPDGDEEEDEEEMKAKAYKKAKKSFGEEMPEEVKAKIEVSDFLKSLVNHTGNTIDRLREYVAKSDLAHESRYDEVVKAIQEVHETQAKTGIVLKAICEKIGIIESAPARAAKADTVAKSQTAASATQRQFNSGLEASQEASAQEPMFKSLSSNPVVAKSQIANVLCDLVKKGEANDLDVIGFESQGYVRPELLGKLKSALN